MSDLFYSPIPKPSPSHFVPPLLLQLLNHHHLRFNHHLILHHSPPPFSRFPRFFHHQYQQQYMSVLRGSPRTPNTQNPANQPCQPRIGIVLHQPLPYVNRGRADWINGGFFRNWWTLLWRAGFKFMARCTWNYTSPQWKLWLPSDVSKSWMPGGPSKAC